MCNVFFSKNDREANRFIDDKFSGFLSFALFRKTKRHLGMLANLTLFKYACAAYT